MRKVDFAVLLALVPVAGFGFILTDVPTPWNFVAGAIDLVAVLVLGTIAARLPAPPRRRL